MAVTSISWLVFFVAVVAIEDDQDFNAFFQATMSPGHSDVQLAPNSGFSLHSETEAVVQSSAVRVFSKVGFDWTTDLGERVHGDEQAKHEITKLWTDLETVGTPRLSDVFDIERFISKGCCGSVFAARNRHTGTQVALKLVELMSINDVSLEWYASKRLRENLVKGVVLTEEQVYIVNLGDSASLIKEQYFLVDSGTQYMCLVQPFMPYKTMLREKIAPEMAFKSLRDTASVLAAMHKNHVLHGDVGPANILIEKRNDTFVSGQVIDLGNAEIGDDFSADMGFFGICLGTALFRLAVGDEEAGKSEVISLDHKDHTKPNKMVSILAKLVEGKPVLQRFYDILVKTMTVRMDMGAVADLMAEACMQPW